MAESRGNTIGKLLDILKFEKTEISSIYFYAILAGLVQLSLPLGIQSIISFVLGGAISTSLVILIIVVIVGTFVSGSLQVSQMKVIEKIQQQLFVRYSFRYADTIPKLSMNEVDGYYLPELVNRFFDTVALQKGIAKLLLDIPAATIQIVFGLILLSFYHPVFIFFGLLLIIVLYMILRTTGDRGLQTSMEESNYKYKVAGYLQELARVITTFKFSRNNFLHLGKTDEFVAGYLKARTAHFKILLFQYWTLIVFKVVIVAAMLIVGAYLLVDQQLNIGQFIAAEMVILMVIGSVEKLIMNLDMVYDALTSVDKINKLIEKPIEHTGSTKLMDSTEGLSIKASSLSFGYTPDKMVLQHLNFDIPSGSKICITGPYSSGKSTLLRLLSGTYQNFKGSLLFNGLAVRNIDINSIRAKTGILLHIQDIFQGTLKENICVGDDNISYEQLNKLSEMTGLQKFIESHQEGYEYYLQPAGHHLSGRVIKRILLMRALIHNPLLLLLEEPWLGLEQEYADNIQKYLLETLADKTVIVASNDQSFAAKCDFVFVMDEGTITSIRKK